MGDCFVAVPDMPVQPSQEGAISQDIPQSIQNFLMVDSGEDLENDALFEQFYKETASLS
jgi:hypothetical protein